MTIYIFITSMLILHISIGKIILVVMLRGVKTKWKQTIAAEALFKFIQNIIECVESIGYKIHGILSDMGAKN